MGLALGFGLWAFGVKGLGGVSGFVGYEDERKNFQESFRVTVFALPDMTT